jgi:predicted HicB family RNase H-like nuclease
MTQPSAPYSGTLNLRMSTDLHAHLVADAAKHGVSLNQRIVTLLAGASGFKKPQNAETPPGQ